MASNLVRRLYIHFPFCRHRCNYCDFHREIMSSGFNFENFHQYLKASLSVHQELMQDMNISWGKLKSLYVGGGTPSMWEQGPIFLKELMEEMQISFDQEYEFTYEMNPGVNCHKNLQAWMHFGLNRVSVGIQSMNERYLKMLDRFHNLDETLQTLRMLRELRINYSVDFMIGLPRSPIEEKRKIVDELAQVLEFNPSHMSVYILTTGKNYIHAKNLPLDAEIEREYYQVSDFLKNQGWLHYEVSNFAKPGSMAMHNMAYWNLESVAALGPSATGLIKNGRKCIRYKWLTEFAQFSREELKADEQRMEEIYLGLRTHTGIDLAQFKTNLDSISNSRLEEIFLGWKRRGLLAQCAPKIILNSKGMLLLDSLMNELFWVEKLFNIQ
ncbi:MAG: coproporphyrinogen III oxidase family protein [Bdellovibrio sp.]|nr:coproporphyrinogen III oxidase family protein [Bdellovibrio sp.]